MNKESQDAFEAQAALMIEMAFMSPRERQNNVARLAKSMLEKDNHIADIYVKDDPASDRKWAGLRLFAQTLSESQRLSVLRGSTISVPLNQLSEEGQVFAKSLTSSRKSFVNGVEQPPVSPTLLCFSLSRYFGKQKELSAKLMIGVGGQEGFQSRSFIGVLDFGLRRQLEEQWFHAGDQKTHLLASQTIVQPEKKNSVPALKFRPLASKLAEVAEATPLSFMAVLPDTQEANLPNVYQKKVEEVLAEWRKEAPEPIYKWREDMLLVSYPSWFYGDDALHPYQTVKRLRAAAQANKGFLPLSDTAAMLTILEPSQRERLAEEFADLNSARHLQPFFALAKTSPQIYSGHGLAVNEFVRAVLARSSFLPPLKNDETLEAVRLFVQRKERKAGQLESRVNLEMRTNLREWFAVSGFTQVPVKPKSTP